MVGGSGNVTETRNVNVCIHAVPKYVLIASEIISG